MGHVTDSVAYVHVSSHAIGNERYGYPDMETFRKSISEKYRPLLIGPIKDPVNSGEQWVFLSSGSKDGWDDATNVYDLQKKFMDLFSWSHDDGSSPYNRFHVLQGEATHKLSVNVQTEYGCRKLSTRRCFNE